MSLSELLKNLYQSRGPDPSLNEAILRYLTSEESREVPSDSIPHFTVLLEQAYNLSRALCHNSSGGCSWENGPGSAKIDEGCYFVAASPEMALCSCTRDPVPRSEPVQQAV